MNTYEQKHKYDILVGMNFQNSPEKSARAPTSRGS